MEYALALAIRCGLKSFVNSAYIASRKAKLLNKKIHVCGGELCLARMK